MDRDRLRASHAFAFAARHRGREEADKVLSRVRELPSMLQTNGLLATWAFYLASGDKNGYKPVAEGVLDYLRKAGALGPKSEALTIQTVFSERWLLVPDEDGGLSGAALRSLTAEAILYAVWLKRAGEALLSGVGAGVPEAAAGENANAASSSGSLAEGPEESDTP